MATSGGIVLSNTSYVTAGSSASRAVPWLGSVGTIVIAATQFAPSVQIVLVGVGATNQRIIVNSTTLTQNQIIPMWLPAGSYQVESSGGSSIGLYCAFCPTTS